MMFRRVDFPEPDGPVIASQSRCSTSRPTSVRAVTTGSIWKVLQILASSNTVLAVTERRSSAGNSWWSCMSASTVRVLVADNDTLPWRELLAGHFDIAAGGEPGLDGDEFEAAA